MKYEFEYQKGVYLREDRYERAKESFKFVHRLLEDRLEREGASLLDVGTAAGEFPYFVRSKNTKVRIVGVDLIPELIEKARSKVPGCEFRAASALDAGLFPARSFPVVTSIGVFSSFRFDQIEAFIHNVCTWVAPGGRVVLFDKVNPSPADTVTNWRHSVDDEDQETHFFAAVYSIRTIEQLVRRVLPGAKIEAHPFEMPFDVAPYKGERDDFLRLWTFKTEDGKRQQVNGLGVIQHQTALVIDVPA
jgi:cyclopropane fatty-acyl-phospholipid synthase-like methyltransferase